MTDYLLDANVFIQAKNFHYGFDFCPAFWDWLDEQNRDGKVASVEKVADELRAGTDELAQWTAARGDSFFLRPDDTVVPALRTVSDWASTQGYEPAAVATFLQIADFWLVAHGLAYGCAIVSHEVPAGTTPENQNSKRLYRAGSALPDPIPSAAPGGGEIRVGVFEIWLISASDR